MPSTSNLPSHHVTATHLLFHQLSGVEGLTDGLVGEGDVGHLKNIGAWFGLGSAPAGHRSVAGPQEVRHVQASGGHANRVNRFCRRRRSWLNDYSEREGIVL